MPPLADLQAPALLAVASHLVFANYEPSAAVVVALYVIGSASLLFLDPGETLLDTLRRLSIAVSVYTGTLFASMAVYRLFLHRIRHIPGPRSLALSKWASVPVDLAGKRPVLIDGLHKQFGTLVRTGPREVSINDVKAVSAVLGANSACTKGPWYCAVQGGKGPRSLSLHATLEPSEHKARRRIWDAGFSVASLKAYTSELKDTNEKLMSQLEKYAQSGKEVQIDHWCQFFSFDIMGMLGFSRSFDLIGNGNFSRPIELLESAMEMIMVLGSVPYMAPVARLAPNPLREFEDFTESALKERTKRGASAPDLFSHLLGEDKESGWKHTWNELNADAGLIVVAGSDTSSSVLTMTLYELVNNPTALKDVRAELDRVFGDDEADDFDRLSKECPLLNAVLNETMRLYPPVPSGVQRVTPAQGLSIKTERGPIVLPGNIIVSIPTTTIHRDPRYFSPQPNAFRPQRWLTPDKEEAFDRNAFIPFGHGPTGCVGKALAWMEMRLMLATVVRRFDLAFAPGFDAKTYPDCIKDAFTMARSRPLPMVIKKRM